MTSLRVMRVTTTLAPGQITDLCGQDASDHFSSTNLGFPPIRYLRGYLRSG